MASKKAPSGEIINVTADQLGEYLGLTGRRVRQLKTEGIVVGARNSHYDLKTSVKNYIEHLKEKVEGRTSDKIHNDIELEKLLHERIKKRKSELLVEQMEGKLHRAEDVGKVWGNMVVAIKARLQAIPIKTSPQLVDIDDINEVQAILKREIYDVLTELSDYDPAAFEVKGDIDAYEEETTG